MKSGNLLTVFHGSRNNFTVFDILEAGASNKNAKVGFWFTESKAGAENFANSVWYGKNKEAKAYETYLNIKNPKIYEPLNNEAELENLNNKLYNLSNQIRKTENKNIYLEIEKNNIEYANDEELKMISERYYSTEEKRQNFLEDLKEYKTILDEYKETEKEYDNKKYNDSYEQFRTDIYSMANKSAEDANFGGTGMYLENEDNIIKKFKDKLIKQGYDGIIIKNTRYDSNTMGKNNNQYVAFYPEQIKNVTNTNPTSNDDIRYMKKDKSQTKNITNKPYNEREQKGVVNKTAKELYQDELLQVDDSAAKTNAEGVDRFIEQQIKRLEKTRAWDNTIPPTSRSDIRKTIEDYLGLGIKRGHFRQKAYGIYKPVRDVIRVREYKDMDNVLHEVGHALDLGNRIKVDKESIANELFTAIDKHGGYEKE